MVNNDDHNGMSVSLKMELLLLSGHILMMVMVIMLVNHLISGTGPRGFRSDYIDGGADSDNVGISVSLSSDGTIVAKHPKFLMIMVLVMP